MLECRRITTDRNEHKPDICQASRSSDAANHTILKEYGEGKRAAHHAIDAGVPRWMCTTNVPFGQEIDPGTGLPIAHVAAAPNRIGRLAKFLRARIQRAEIAAAIKSGEVTVDFRPLLMTRPEVIRSMSENRIGTLSMDNPRLEAPDGDFVLELRRAKSKKKSCLDMLPSQQWRRMATIRFI